MPMVKCRTCNGTYEPLQADGTRYYHACPPLERATVDRLGALVDVDARTVQPGERVVRQFTIDRPNHRDENLKVIAFDASGNAIVDMKAPGAGVDRV